MPKYYHDDPRWADIDALPQDDGGPYPLAAIAYTDEYSEAMSYLRAVMARNEMSERVLELTEHIIDMNPAHYTVWLYRAKVLSATNSDLSREIAWLNPTALRHLKNYQIWHHRQTIIDKLDSHVGEADFIATMLEQDAKNYHVWSYRQWLVKRFALFPGKGGADGEWDGEKELKWTEGMIEADVRNNSAWNHRWFVVLGGREGETVSDDFIKREIDYAQAAIRKAPQNQSSWNYLRGIVRHAKLPVSALKDFALEFATLESSDQVHSCHALDLLAEIYAAEENTWDEAAKAFELLATKYDPVRAQYWKYRQGLLRQGGVVA
ncbi:farnesyltransferas-like protein [Zopfia rhizophila CBS 207.26]|uniref:Protein farnesyltransferase/geranylgeranyltransferase type-1 subunit alpha n=1 Tax=Zopfia rhizophila CBS 207.26 TaxID=1314779 RepID=A0A6A6DL41_9PEZI|nr:farnesyltransferas-like protein [Zopfia rhizophila CBS 207.26]